MRTWINAVAIGAEKREVFETYLGTKIDISDYIKEVREGN